MTDCAGSFRRELIQRMMLAGLVAAVVVGTVTWLLEVLDPDGRRLTNAGSSSLCRLVSLAEESGFKAELGEIVEEVSAVP